MSKVINIYATRADIEPGLRSIESKYRLKYILSGRYDSRQIESFDSALQIKDLGIAIAGTQVHEKAYLIISGETHVRIREIRLRKGGLRFAVDQLVNPTSIIFRPGGLFESRSLIAGRIETVSDHPKSIEMCKDFSSELTKGFTKIKNYYVGPEAVNYLDSGLRLTHSLRMSQEYDLKR